MADKSKKYTHSEIIQKFMVPGISFILAGVTGFFASTCIARFCLVVFGMCLGSTQAPEGAVNALGTVVCVAGLLCTVFGIALLLYAFYLKRGMRHGE